ncbi:MAG: sporulation protein YjcZ [Erysipelotrichaceae bacterium]|nr:sporulation protein YjcZ [Erysipelotrichaceae bacterium]
MNTNTGCCNGGGYIFSFVLVLFILLAIFGCYCR